MSHKSDKREEDMKSLATTSKSRGSDVRLAIIAAIFATCGSLFGKLAGSAVVPFVEPLLLQGILLILMVISNTVGCVFFVKALNGSESSLPATVTSTTTNYLLSALLGVLIFGESTSLIWWCGVSLVILGLIIICYAANVEDSASAQRKLKQQ